MDKLTPKQRAIRVLASQGKAPGMLTRMTTEDIVKVASMSDGDGIPVQGAGKMLSDLLACRGCGEGDE